MSEKQLGEYIITIDDVNKTFPGGVQAVKGFSAKIRRREVVVIMGPSGSGKSTLLRCLNGLEEADSGTIVVDDIPLDDNHKHRMEIRKEVGMVFQSFNLFPHLTALENVNLAQVRVRKKGAKEATKLSMELLKKVGISEKAGNYPAQLSGGQQQRVAIARALALRPDILLLDEVTSALDPELVNEVLDTIRLLSKEGRTMIIVSHEMAFVKEIADKVVFMDQGRIVEIGTPEDIMDHPQTDRAREFMAKILRH
jgi:polar amino acid transport system ATP-binding protein